MIDGLKGLIFFVIAHLAFGALGAIPGFFAEREIFYYQRSAKYYSTFPYFASVILLDIPTAVLEAALFGTIIYWMAGLRGNVLLASL
jgi:ABC-type microcin C transport system permease subunit YejE